MFKEMSYVYAVYQEKSFTKAAAELSYAQSTVTTQIQQLEKELGYQLFDRIGKTVSLTALGEEFLQYAYEMQRTVDKAMNLDKDPTHLHGTLRLGVLESLLFGTIPEVLASFRSRYPNVQLQLKMGQTTELVQQLKENRLDMVYLSGMENTDSDLTCCYSRREELVFFCASDHPAASAKTVKELMEYDFVITERSGICYGRLQELAARCDCALRACVEVDSTVVICNAVEQGLGIAFLPKYALRQQLEEGRLQVIRTDLPPQYYYSQILCHKRRWISPFMEGMIKMIEQKRPV